jgi:hypothetical protein
MLEQVNDQKGAISPQKKHEQDHCMRMLKRIKVFDKQLKDRALGWKEARQYANGDPCGDDEDGLVRVNLVGSMLDAVQPSIYARAPEIAVEVDERLDTTDYPMIKRFAKTLENALNVFLVKDAKLKTRGKAAVRGALTSTVGFVKVIYQVDYRDDPVIRNRINDTQDNIERINLLLEETDPDGQECAENTAKLFELQQQVMALEKQVEVVAAEGVVVDVLRSDDLIVLDPSVRDIDEFDQASAIAHKIKMTIGEFKRLFKKSPPTGVNTYVLDTDEESKDENKDYDNDDKMIVVYEVWSLSDLTVYTLCEGAKEYIREPYQPTTLGEKWYPFFGLQLRRVEGVKYPRSFVEQLIELQDEYNTLRTNAKEHRQKNIPVRLVNKAAGITDEEITRINGRSIRDDVIGVTCDNPDQMANQLVGLPEIPYNPAMYDPSGILYDMERVGNTQDAAVGAVRKAKTATEAEIAASGQQGRASESLDVVEDWLSDISTYSAQLLLQNVPEETIKRRFGASSVWPTLNKQDLFELVNITIRAGSTSKPNKMRERDQWIQLLPEIQKALDTLITAKQSSNTQLEHVVISLLDETFKRFDEKLDVRSLLGLTDEEGNEIDDEPEIPPEVIQKMEQMKQQLEAVTAENEQLKADRSIDQQKVDIEQQEADTKTIEALGQGAMQ